MNEGLIVSFSDLRGYGFVLDDLTRLQYFFHVNEALDRHLKCGDRVTYRLVSSKNKQGAICCVDTQKI